LSTFDQTHHESHLPFFHASLKHFQLVSFIFHDAACTLALKIINVLSIVPLNVESQYIWRNNWGIVGGALSDSQSRVPHLFRLGSSSSLNSHTPHTLLSSILLLYCVAFPPINNASFAARPHTTRHHTTHASNPPMPLFRRIFRSPSKKLPKSLRSLKNHNLRSKHLIRNR
jgi:hypothetical protein